MLGAGFKPVGELHSQPFDSAFVAEASVREGGDAVCVRRWKRAGDVGVGFGGGGDGEVAAGTACCGQLVVWCARLSALGCLFVCLSACLFVVVVVVDSCLTAAAAPDA